VGIEEWLVKRLLLAEPYIPKARRVFLKRLSRALLGWLLVPFEFLRYADSQLRGSVQAGSHGRGLTVVIVEPNLGGKPALGHEMAFSLTVATGLLEQGIDVEVFGHRRLAPAVAAAFAERGIRCRKVFSTMHLGMVPVAAADRGIGMLGRFFTDAFAFAADLTWALARTRATSQRVLFFPTAGLSCVLASSRLRWRRSHPAESQLHVLHTAGQLGGRGPYASWLRRMLRASPGVHVGAVNPLINTELGALGEANAIMIPIPRPAGLGPEPASPIARRRIGFLGNANAGKGFLRLPALIPRLLASPGSFEIVVQTNPYLTSPAIEEAIATLRRAARQSNRIELVEAPLAMDAYYELLRGLDVVVVPYDVAVYAEKISSVAIEAMALGKVVVGPDSGWFADQQRAYAGYLGVNTADPEQLARRILDAIEQFDTLTQYARRDAAKFEWHNVQSLVTLLKELADRDQVTSLANTPRRMQWGVKAIR
jgi:hypothetical protein